MDRFTFYADYYNLLMRLRKKSEREQVAMAIIEFVFEGKEPNGLTETAEIAFEGIRQSLEKSRNNGGRGGRKSKNRNETELKPIENRIETDCQPKDNRNETETKPNFFEIEKNKEKKDVQKKDNKKDKDNPLFISPKGNQKKPFEDDFFNKYPRYEKDRAKMRVDVDYKRLIEEFEKSTYLRNLYTVKQINDIYACIIAGDYRDQEKKPSLTADIDAKVERERWYSGRRNKALADAEKVKATFMKDETFAKVERRLREIDVEQAKAEVKGDKVKASKLEQEKARLRLQKRGIIERQGMTEEDLEPKWHCRKCEDTGFINGVACSCYEG